MYTVIPAYDVLKSVVDVNIDSEPAKERERAFSVATELTTLAKLDVLIDRSVYDRLAEKLNDDHKTFFESTYRFDRSTTSLTYDHKNSLKWIAQSESASKRVIVVTDNGQEYKQASDRIECYSPEEFNKKVIKVHKLMRERVMSTYEDAILSVFFPSEMTSEDDEE